MVIPKTDFQAGQNCPNSIFSLYTVFPCMCAGFASPVFNFLVKNLKKWGVTQDLYSTVKFTGILWQFYQLDVKLTHKGFFLFLCGYPQYYY